ncbi:MAG: CPBP family intramembrane metalloprotease [Bacteroidota bacterium]|nr:CPBP family intramembrane metalloprotease [Bacteroidota bacterium]
MNLKKIAWFVLFAFGISWLSAGIVYACGVPYGSGISVIITAAVYMLAPAISACIVQKLMYKQPLQDLGLDFKIIRWKQFLWLPVMNIAFCILTICMIYLFGNIMNIEGFGEYSLDQDLFNTRMEEIIKASGGPSAPNIPVPPGILLILILFGATLLGGIVNLPATFGEELGWRGWMYNELEPLGFLRSNLITGFIWGIWHAPLILQGHNYPEHPVAGVFMMIPFCTALSFIMSFARKMTNSVLAPAALHGMINSTAGGVMLFCYGSNDLLGNLAGVAGILAATVIVCVLSLINLKKQKTG